MADVVIIDECELDPMVRDFLTMQEEHRRIGIAHRDFVNGKALVPPDYCLHWATSYWLPPNYLYRSKPERLDA
jgi:hypothetical protein